MFLSFTLLAPEHSWAPFLRAGSTRYLFCCALVLLSHLALLSLQAIRAASALSAVVG